MADPAAAAAAPTPSAELARLRARVAAAPQDFDAWVALVGESEKSKDVAAIRSATSGLLASFPLCFGYWQRLAKLEAAQTGQPHADAATIERGLESVPHSHELWTFYVSEIMKNAEANPDDLRSVFVRGSTALSTDSGASLFWDKYLEFELTQFASAPVQASLQLLPPPYTGTLIGGVYALILSLPLRDLDKYYATFAHKFAINYPLNYLATPQEAAEYTAAYPKEVPPERATYAAADGTQQTVTLTQYLNDWELEQRRLLLAKRDYVFRTSLALRDEKFMFESQIARPYFHVAPVPVNELANWNALLDFMEAKLVRGFAAAHPTGPSQPQTPIAMEKLDPLTLADTIKCYERCLIPCAAYAEFWDRYAIFLEQLNEPLRAIEVRQRALVFLQRNVVAGSGAGTAAVQECMVALAELEEKEGRFDQAREWLSQAVQITPTPPAAAAAVVPASATDMATPLMEALLAQIQFERRQWRAAHPDTPLFDQAAPLLQLYAAALERISPEHSLHNAKAYTFLALHHIQFTLTQVEFASPTARVTAVRELFDRAAAHMYPQPVTSVIETPAGPLAADGTPTTPATSHSHTVVPRLTPSKQFLTFWTAFLDFESQVAQSPLAALRAIYERALTVKQTVSAAVAAANPHVLLGGASGLGDAARRELWTSFVTTMEDRADSAADVEKTRQEAKQAMVSTARTHARIQLHHTNTALPAVGPPSLLSVLGKRKHAASPLPLQAPKIARPLPPPPQVQQRWPQQGFGAQPAYPSASPTAEYYQQSYQ